MPYLRRINATTTKTYASRTLLFLQSDGVLKPLAIDEDQLGVVSKVYTPAEDSVEGSVWQLAKAYVAVNDSGVHQLFNHWLNTHAVIEPFVIATNRQLSVMHPIHKLLHPHFGDTMNINSSGRQFLINAGGILEATVFPTKYAMELSSAIYKDWKFPDQALPVDLMKMCSFRFKVLYLTMSLHHNDYYKWRKSKLKRRNSEYKKMKISRFYGELNHV